MKSNLGAMLIDYDAFLQRNSSNFIDNMNIDTSKNEIQKVDESVKLIKNKMENEINRGDAIQRLALVHVLIETIINKDLSLSSLFEERTSINWDLLNTCLDELLDLFV